MLCPYCSFPRTSVQDTRPILQGTGVRRKRSCNKCKQRFITTEVAQANSLMVIKSNGGREAFESKKIEQAVYSAFKHRANPNYVARIVTNIVQRIEKNYLKSISSKDIVLIILRHLRKSDITAYIRFVAWNKDFDTLQQFIKACQPYTTDTEE